MQHKGSDESSKQLALDLVEISKDLLNDYKARMLVSAKKSFSNAVAKPNSTLASLIEESKRINFIKSLIASRGTLIVIPSVLMDHWEVRLFLMVAHLICYFSDILFHSLLVTNRHARGYEIFGQKAAVNLLIWW
jgi:hypothetical protein